MKVPIIVALLVFRLSANGVSLETLETRMSEVEQSMINASSDEEKLIAADSLRFLFIQSFDDVAAFNYPFNKLFGISTIKSSDEAFRLINWNVALSNGGHRYFCFILFPEKASFVEFHDRGELVQGRSTVSIDPDDWYGALYYTILPVKTKKETFYMLLGWDGHTKLSTFKIIDVLSVNKRKQIVLGKPLIQSPEGIASRYVFEYEEQAHMTLQYIKEKNAIVFDRLVPLASGLSGQFAFYRPGSGHDAYRWDEDMWVYEEFIDMSRPKSEEKGAQFYFPDRVDFQNPRKKVNPLTGK